MSWDWILEMNVWAVCCKRERKDSWRNLSLFWIWEGYHSTQFAAAFAPYDNLVCYGKQYSLSLYHDIPRSGACRASNLPQMFKWSVVFPFILPALGVHTAKLEEGGRVS